jgi:hypothetical protein
VLPFYILLSDKLNSVIYTLLRRFASAASL